MSRGFSLIELLTAVAIVGTLAVIGIKTYKSKIYESQTVEARHSLTAVYKSEKVFNREFQTFHENLFVMGFIPLLNYYYDVGFGNIAQADISKTDGRLGSYPLKAALDVVECTNFRQICDKTAQGCLEKTKTAAGTGYADYFKKGAKCKVTGKLYSKHTTAAKQATAPSGADKPMADDDEFVAMASAKLKSADVWIIDEEGKVKHVQDGTQ